VSSSRAVKDDSSDPDDVCDDPEIVKLMIEYFYHFDYLLSPDLELEPEPELKAEPIQPQEDDLGWFLIERKKERKDKGIPSDLPKNLKDKAEVEALMCSIPTLAYGLLTRSREDNDLVRATCVRGSGG